MLINGQEVNIEELIKNSNFEEHLRQNNKLGLTEYQISVLTRNNINHEVSTLKELIYLINDVLIDSDDEALELILEEISERDYYENSHK